MVGLRILLEEEAQRGLNNNPQIINKTRLMRTFSSSSLSSSCFSTNTTFLDACFLCKNRLSPHRDIYMYRGDRAFCSVECRCRQIFMDEEAQETHIKDNCSLAAAAAQSRRRKRNMRNRAGGLFAY